MWALSKMFELENIFFIGLPMLYTAGLLVYNLGLSHSTNRLSRAQTLPLMAFLFVSLVTHAWTDLMDDDQKSVRTAGIAGYIIAVPLLIWLSLKKKKPLGV